MQSTFYLRVQDRTNPTQKNGRLCIADITTTVYCYRGSYVKVIDPEGQFMLAALQVASHRKGMHIPASDGRVQIQ